MENAGHYSTRQIWILNIHIVLGAFLFFYTLGVFNTCQDNISASLNWGSNKTLYISIFSSMISIGAIFGTIIASSSISRYGRRKTMIITDILYICGSIILVMPSTVAFGIGRFLTGICVGIFMTLMPIYVSEVTPEVMMRNVGPSIVISQSIGVSISYALGLALPTDDFENDSFNYWWLFMFLFPAAVSSYQLWYFLFIHTKDTPQFYMSKNMNELAKTALEITYQPIGMQAGLRRINSEHMGKVGRGKEITFCSLFTQKKFRKMMRVGCMLSSLNQFSAITPIIFFSTKMFGEFGGGLFLARVLTFITGIVSLFSSILTIFLLRLFGRKTLLVSGQFLLAVDLFLLGIFSGYVDAGIAPPAVFVISFFIFFIFSLGTTMWLYIGEVLNENVLSFGCILNRSLAAIISFAFIPAIDAVGIHNVFLFFAASMLVGAIYCMFDLVETKNKDKTEILIHMKVMENATVEPQNDNDFVDEDKKVEVNEKFPIDSIIDASAIEPN